MKRFVVGFYEIIISFVLFYFKKMSFGKYSIRSKKTNKYITIKDNLCILYEKNPSMQQIF